MEGGNNEAAGEGKKVRISFDEFKKLAFMIFSLMKDFEGKGEENVRQGDIVDQMVLTLEVDPAEQRQASVERSIETSKKINNVINYLINNENLLLISQDAKVKADRYLTLNLNCNIDNFNNFLEGGGQAQQ